MAPMLLTRRLHLYQGLVVEPEFLDLAVDDAIDRQPLHLLFRAVPHLPVGDDIVDGDPLADLDHYPVFGTGPPASG